MFTYGPLGFLWIPALYTRPSAIGALLFILVVDGLVAASVLAALRRSFSLPVAVALTYVVAAAAITLSDGATEIALPLLIAAAAGVWTGPAEGPRRRADSARFVAIGVAAGALPLVKLSVGVGALVVAAAAVATAPARSTRRSGAALVPTAAVAAFAAAWFGTGNGFGNLGAYLRTSLATIGGFASAMSLEASGRAVAYVGAAVLLAMLATLAVLQSRELAWRPRAGLLVAVLGVTALLFHEGFVRHDEGHDLVFASCAVLIIAVLRPAAARGRLPAAFAVAGTLLALLASGTRIDGVPARNPYDPVAALHDLAGSASTLATPGATSAMIARGRALLHAHYRLPWPMVSTIAGSTVAVEPSEVTLLWAYPRLRFDTLPVIQDYQAYTSSLDQLDADFLASGAAPRFLLEQPPATVRGQDPAFEPPLTRVVVECRYRQVAATHAWQLLERSTDRCGRPRLLSTVRLRSGERVTVPPAPAGDLVVATFTLSLPFSWQLENTLFKASSESVVLHQGGRVRKVRFEPGTAADYHLLRPAGDLGYAAAFTPPAITSFTLSGPAGSIVVRFYAMPMRPR